MKKAEYSSTSHIEILLKYYYLRRYSRVAVDENITAEKVKRIKENALRIIRLAYSPSYMKGLRMKVKSFWRIWRNGRDRNGGSVFDF